MPTFHYDAEECAAFRRANLQWGGFSNMSSAYPLNVNGHHIRTSEAIYQALKFPGNADVQREIIAERNPINAKRISRRHERLWSRPDWHQQVKIKVMYWCLEVKLAQNFQPMSELLIASQGLHIVESSDKDAYWGARPVPGGFTGQNVLGRLLMRLRRRLLEADQADDLKVVPPLEIPDFTLYHSPISTIDAR